METVLRSNGHHNEIKKDQSYNDKRTAYLENSACMYAFNIVKGFLPRQIQAFLPKEQHSSCSKFSLTHQAGSEAILR